MHLKGLNKLGENGFLKIKLTWKVRLLPTNQGWLQKVIDNVKVLTMMKLFHQLLWLKAIQSEMDSMSENKVWTLTDAPDGVKPIGYKWVFKTKTHMEGKVVTYKARLVAKGYRQRQGVDYD